MGKSWKNGDLTEFIEKNEDSIWIYHNAIITGNRVATWPQQMLGCMASFRLQTMIPKGPRWGSSVR
jgi:hypothetical protein